MVDASKPLVLIADDDAVIITLLHVLLKSWGYACVSASDTVAKSALEGPLHPFE